MKVRRFKRAVPLAAAAALVVSGLVVTLAPSSVEAATFTTIPTRLYMAPAGVSIPNGIAEFVGVQVGTLKFDGSTDPISQDLRSIVVNTVTGSAGCDLTANPYDINDCSRVQIGPISHGRLKMGNITTIPNGAGPGLDVYMLPGAVRIDNPYQVANGSYYLAINGEPTDLNNALKTLVYTPEAGYYYEGSNGENVNVLVQPGNADPSASATIQIRVLNVNGFPTVAAPSDKSAQAGIELKIPTLDPGLTPPFTGRAVTVTDADNDEDVDGGQANPPTPEGTWQDGAGTKMLLVGYLACGTPTVQGASGFHFRGGTFEMNNNDIRSIVRDFFQFTQLPASGQAIITTLLDGIDAVQPGLTTTMLATNDPTTYTSLFAGIGTMSEVQYAVSQISFLQPAVADNCTMWTIVSDLGNNGLPLQYVGDPPTGIEVPMIGLGLDSFDINTGDLDEINISFADPSTLVVNEATAPTPVAGNLVVSPAVHPEFTIQWEVNPHSGDPDVAGIATAGSDFAGTYNNTLTIPENEEFIPILNQVLPDPPNTTVFPDNVDEGNETFMFNLLLNQPAPAGYFVTSSAPTKTVLIVDDDDAPRVVSVDNPSVVEGDSGTSNLTFTLTLDGPADGNESVTVSTADGTATVADTDYDAIAGQVVQFALGETTKTVDVTVHGDLTDELGAVNETLTLNLSGASNVTINTPSGIGAIVNDDQPRTVSIADKSMVEGNAGTSLMTFVLSLDSPAKGNESVTVDTSNGTAMVADSDYVALTGAPVVFAAGSTTATVSVTINGDTTPESNETFNVTLGSNLNVLINDGTAIGTILNDDGVPDVSINDVTVTEGDSGTTAATFTVTLSSAAVVAASVSVATSDGTATIANNDYAAVGPTTVNFAIGDVTKTVTVDVNGDTDVEVDETFNVTLSNPDQLVIDDATGLGTI
ncbi:MAG TPA: Calx-beta domain-containing protein, partial [Ilumatobacteraceae bacterium]|nr:Calx-beta domain-containing protein [Ilumatobacteraceae bacterium]